MWPKLKVLLWKSLQLRKRHWLNTIIEILMPCLLFYFMDFMNSNNLNNETPENIMINQSIPSPTSEDILYRNFVTENPSFYIIYTPQTVETEQIMNTVKTKLNILSENIGTAINEIEMIDKFKSKFNSSQSSVTYSGFGIVFEEAIKTQVLKYKIRSTYGSWGTDQLFPPNEIPGPMDYGKKYLEMGFLALQLTIDKAYILFSVHNKSDLNINDYNLEIQSYPYANYIQGSKSEVLFVVMFSLLTVASFLLMCANTIKRVVEEKDSGVKELMKIMGLKPWMIWTGWILHNFFIYAISIAVITYITCFGTSIGQTKIILNYTNPLLFWILLMVYMIAGVFFCFAISSFFNQPLIALIVGSSVWCISYILPKMLLKHSTSILIQTLFALFPNYAISIAYTAILSLETQRKGLQLSTLFITGKGDNNFSVGLILLMFVVDCFLYGFIAWYIDSVKPGRFGIAKPLNFLCKRPKKETENIVMAPNSKRNSKLFEKPPNNYGVGISVQNLHKHFGNFHAVNGVNLDLYNGQITALLGHNGAGKTTTMSIITGLLSPTYGTVYVNGNDLFSDIDRFRKDLGLCPQHNLLFSYLTTLDHLIFFGMLKGLSLRNAETKGLKLLRLLNILHKKADLVSNLSGGMKRKVSLAIALVGNPKILILDEPTSGMDPESRREMWDLLISFRGTRTILITTHFMEEADVLGDRIAIMDHGQVKCYGSTLFLKKAYGTGYNLTIVKEEPCDESKIIEAIKNIIPEAEVQSSLTAQVVINLPNENTDQFPELFEILELNRDTFSIKAMGISCTTMEEVFLKAERNLSDDEDDMSAMNPPIGVGSYQLIINKDIDCNVDQVTNLIQQYVPEIILMADTEMQIIFDLPAGNKNQFGALFSALEFQKQNVHIKNVKITNPTTGDIYLKSVTTEDDEDDPKEPLNNDVPQIFIPEHTSKINLLKNQFIVLLEKKAIYTYRRWVPSLFFGIGPILLGLLVMQLTNNLINESVVSNGLKISLSAYKGSSVYYRAGDNSPENLEPTFVTISKKNKATVNEVSSENNIINDLLKMCKEDVLKYRTNLMIAGDFNKTKSTVFYNNIAIHTPAIAINLYSNALLQKMSGNYESYISTVNEPIQMDSINECDEAFGFSLLVLWMTAFTPGLLYLIGYFIALPLNERVSGIKHLQMMTKLSPIMYWVTCFIWDYFCYIIVVLFTLAVMYLTDIYNIFTGLNEVGALLTLLFIYGCSAILYTYVYSYLRNTLVSALLLYIAINYILGIFINIVLIGMNDIIRENNKINSFNTKNIIRLIILIIPHFSFPLCLSGFLQITWENNMCKVCKSSKMIEVCKAIGSERKNYFVFKSDEDPNGILEETLFLLFSSILYIFIILLFDNKIFHRLYQSVFNKIYGTGVSYRDINEDTDVGSERKKVGAAITQSNSASSPLLIVDDIVKKFSFQFTGVRGISFAVSPGECFGLLGVNGAGKTTTFRILTGDIFPSKGDASILTDKLYKLSTDINQYVSLIGYCPQFDAINDQLTGRETLKLMAILRGISPTNTKNHVDKWTRLLGLEEHKDRLSGTYSGGNKRKLNTAMALIGDPPVVFLDEPTSGVDPVARRNLWQSLAASQRGGQAIILTSHSMDECEALCNRLTIMVGGVLKCIGNIQYLKNRYGQGFTIMVKLRDIENFNVDELKSDIESQFAPDISLKDEHKGLLHYHINNPNILLSEIFGKMKETKERYSVIEDFTVGDTTLEQVFIAFAKKRAVLNT